MIPDSDKIAKKKKHDIIIVSILLAVFVISFNQNVLSRKKTAQEAPSVNSAALGPSMSDQLVVVTNIRLYDKLSKERVDFWDKEWARDPFVPQQTLTSLTKAVNLTLNGILWDEKTPKAIVNEKMLMIGDTIYGYTVVQIKPRSVVLKTGEKNIELQVFHPVLGDANVPAGAGKNS